MAQLTREEILKKTKLKTEVVPVPEWGGEVTVAELETEEMALWQVSFEAMGKADERVSQLRQSIVARVVVDKNRKPIFKQEDVAALGKMSYAAVDRVFEVASRLNRILKKDQDELVKNSEEASS